VAITAQDLKKWIDGASLDAEEEESVSAPDLEDDEGEDKDLVEAEEDAELGDRNKLWAGEEEAPEAITLADSEELLEWLADNEPEIADAIFDLASAIADGDAALLEHAQAELAKATQYLNPEYPPMSEEQKASAGEKIAEHMKAKGHPKKGSKGWKQAVAIGLSQARQAAKGGD
jgi:hypothetical protein